MKKHGKDKEPPKNPKQESSAQYLPPFFLYGSHLETIFPALLRRVILTAYTRERISTPDDDFLDLDWLKKDSGKVVIISHGLEGNSSRPYIKGMAKALYDKGFDVVAWNFRGCSEEMNRQLRFYHSGATDDLHTVVNHVIENRNYKEVFLVGFSLGGNMTLKYLGERAVSDVIKKAVVFSVPMDLKSSCEKISRPVNRIYSNRFLKSLKGKILLKSRHRKELDTSKLRRIKTLTEFDDFYTAPLHGFKDANDYYQQCSSVRFVKDIKTPTLIINTLNDPFLSRECFPAALLEDHPFVNLQILSRGGHVGFTQFNKNGLYWSEQRALEFLAAPKSPKGGF
ncbi:MAG: alpha/beta fold hydrolase [Cyclobacteriaceae bacterium]